MSNTIDHQRHWDQKYAQGNTHSDYQADSDLVKHIGYAPKSGMALDVACGTGRNSFFLAQHGLDVICMDFSAKGLNYLKQHQTDESVSKKLFPIQADLTKTPLPERFFDLVVVIRYLDRQAYSNYIGALKPDGLLFFKAFNLNHLKRKPGFNPDFLLQPGELARQFKDKKILHTNDAKDMTEFESFILLKNQATNSLAPHPV